MNETPVEQAIRSLRGHIGRLKHIGRLNPEVLQQALGIERAASVICKAVSGAEESASPTQLPERNPLHFLPNGRNLSDEGRTFLYGLFDEGFSVRGAAARIGISIRAAAEHRSHWLRRDIDAPN